MPSRKSLFLLHTPAKALEDMSQPSRLVHRTQTPASILYNNRWHQRFTPISAATTPPYRGDQQPPSDEEELIDHEPDFVPLDERPVTIQPIYSINEHDLQPTGKRIYFVLQTSFFHLCFFVYTSF